LRGPALAWWQSYWEINENANEMMWADFVKVFRDQHIPNNVMKLKKDEFRKLRQGRMTVTEYLHKFTELSRYAPDDVNDDEKKQEAFLGGLNPEIRTLVEVTTHSDFNAMVNRAITIERNRKAELSERKHRFEGKKPQ
jgi:predicted PolB exonuclease-like 3'-5' exonuclease